MNQVLVKAIKLGFITAVATLLLAVVNHYAEPQIKALRQQEIESTLTMLVKDKPIGEKEAVSLKRIVNRWPINPDQGWILELVGKGYGGDMTILIAYTKDGEVIAARLLSNNETVGFGKKAEDPAYMDIFVGKGASAALPVKKSDLGDMVDVVSGATITFNGLSQAVAMGSQTVKEWAGQ